MFLIEGQQADKDWYLIGKEEKFHLDLTQSTSHRDFLQSFFQKHMTSEHVLGLGFTSDIKVAYNKIF